MSAFRDPHNRRLLQRTARKASEARAELHAVIRAVAEEETIRAIAEAVGYSVGKVHQIKTGRPS